MNIMNKILLLLPGLLLSMQLTGQNKIRFDSTFNGNGQFLFPTQNLEGVGVLAQADGKILVYGNKVKNAYKQDLVIGRLTSDGVADTSFNHTGFLTGNIAQDYSFSVAACKHQPDGKYVVAAAGKSDSLGKYSTLIFRYNNDGSLDNQFGTNGLALFTDTSLLNNQPLGFSILPNGKILVCGYRSDEFSWFPEGYFLFQLLPDGSLDETFGSQGRVYISSDIVVVRGFEVDSAGVIQILATEKEDANDHWVVMQIDSDGALLSVNRIVADYDLPGGLLRLNFLTAQSDGKLLVGGDYYYRNIVFRLNQDLTLDSTFNHDGVFSEIKSNGFNGLENAFVLANNKIGLYFGESSGIGRLNENGSADWAFANLGFSIPPSPTLGTGIIEAFEIAFQVDGKIIMGFIRGTNFLIGRYMEQKCNGLSP